MGQNGCELVTIATTLTTYQQKIPELNKETSEKTITNWTHNQNLLQLKKL